MPSDSITSPKIFTWRRCGLPSLLPLSVLVLASCSSERPINALSAITEITNRAIEGCQLPEDATISAYLVTSERRFLLNPNFDGLTASRTVMLTTGQEIRIELQYGEDGDPETIATATTVVPPPPENEISFVDSIFTLSCPLEQVAITPDVDEETGIPEGEPTTGEEESVDELTDSPLISANQVLQETPPDVRIVSRCSVPNNSFPLIGSPAATSDGIIVTGGHNLSIVSACFSQSGFRQPWPQPEGIENEFASREVALDSAGNIFSYRITSPGELPKLIQFSTSGLVERIYTGSESTNSIRTAALIDGSDRVIFPMSHTELAISTDIENPQSIPISFTSFSGKGAISRNGVAYFTGTNRLGLLAVDLNNFLELPNQNCSTSSGSWSSPGIDSVGNVVFGTIGGRIYSCSSDLQFNWVYPSPESSQTPSEFRSSAIIDEDDNIYMRSNDGIIYSVNNSGALRWRLDTGVSDINGMGSPVLSEDGRLYYADSTGVNAIDKESGQRLWRFTGDSERTFQDAGSSPSLLPNGFLVFRAAQSVYVVDVQGGGLSTAAAWPKWGRDLRNTSQQ